MRVRQWGYVNQRVVVGTAALSLIFLGCAAYIGKVNNPTSSNNCGAFLASQYISSNPTALNGFPCPVANGGTAGVPAGTTLTHLTSCTGPVNNQIGGNDCTVNGMPGLFWSSSGGFFVNTCGVVINNMWLDDIHGLSDTVGNAFAGGTDYTDAHACLLVKNSQIERGIGTGFNANAGPVVVHNSLLHETCNCAPGVPASQLEGTVVCCNNYSLDHVQVYGGGFGANCVHCNINDSYISDQYYISSATCIAHGDSSPSCPSHLNGTFQVGGFNSTFTHDTIVCHATNPQDFDGHGGCSGDIQWDASGSVSTGFTLSNNFFAGNQSTSNGPSYCAYFSLVSGFNVKNNIWGRGLSQKCGGNGVQSGQWVIGSSGTWCNNTFEDGVLAQPALESGNCV